MKWRNCCAWYCFLLSLSGTLLLAYITALCGLEIEYLQVDNKPRGTWVAGVGSGVYLLCFLGSGAYICLNRRKARLKVRENGESYSQLLPIDSFAKHL